MNRTVVEEIKARIPIEELISSYVKIDKSGRSYKAKCPFHNEKTASFFISPERGGYFCFGCFPPGQLVRTPFGYHAIETLDVNHYVYSGKGNIRKILATQHREYKGSLIDVDVQKLGGTVSLTSDHNLPIIRPKTKYYKKTKQFYRQISGYGLKNNEKVFLNQKQVEKHADILKIPTEELKVGDFVLYPIPKAISSIDLIDLRVYLDKKSSRGPKVRDIPYTVPVNEDLLKLIGYYIAEGSNHRAYIRFSLGNHEEDFAQEIIGLIKNIFGLEAKIHRRKKGSKTGIEITACHAYLADIFANLCGKGSSNKHIPFVFQELPYLKQMIIVNAVNKRDGHTYKPLLSSHRVNTITVVSRLLIEQITDILLRNNIFPSVYSAKKRIDKHGVRHKETHSVKWSNTASVRHEVIYQEGNSVYWLLPVKKVARRLYNGPVYNFTVEEDHTYIAKNFAVANCGAKGDIFSFVEQFEGLDFKGALKILAEKAGVPLIQDQKNDSERDQYFKITEQAAVYFEDQYKKSKEAQDYIKSRGINPESRESFRIGWAPEGWQNLLNHLKTKGWSEGVIEKAGFIKKREDSVGDSARVGLAGYYDRFRGRIIFPIMDSSGRVVAFTGRILKDDGQSAKYLNSPETPIFIKSQILFGLDKAKSEIRRLNYSILVEGQMDLVLSHQVGVKNTIAASGTALTDQAQGESGVVSNLGMVRRLSPNMIIALDSDKAGRTATMRAVVATALSMGMSVKIADASADGFAGKDPADLILQNPENWKIVLKNAKHVIEFELRNIMNEIKDPHGLGRAIKDRIFPFLSKMDSEMDKAFYMKMIAEKAGMNEQAVWDDLRKFEKTAKVENSAKNIASSNSSQKNPFSSHQQVLKNNSTSSTGSSGENLTKADNGSRIDMVQRRMFGLLSLIEKSDNAQAGKYRDKIKAIADNNYANIVGKIEPHLGDMAFEAESFYGDDKERFSVHMDELLANFELDVINEELIQTMAKLRIAEKAGNATLVAEMAKKCQELSVRKAGVGKSVRV